MKKVKTQRNYKSGKGYKVKGKSMTVQNESITIAELLRKHLHGQPIEERSGQYVDDADEDDLDLQSFNRMDLAEKEDVIAGIRAMKERLKNLELEYKEELKIRAEALKTPPKEGEETGTK